MVNSLRDQVMCRQCWRPSLETHSKFLYCPSCDTKYTKELQRISGPSVDVFHQTAMSVVKILQQVGRKRKRLTKLLDGLGLEQGASTEQWILAVHYLKILHRHYRNYAGKPSSALQYMTTNPLAVPPPSKRSFPGSFTDYSFKYWRSFASPFTSLSDTSFQIILSTQVRNTLPWPLHRLYHAKERSECFTSPRYKSHYLSDLNWREGLDELLSVGLVEKAPFEANLQFVSARSIRQTLKKYDIKGGRRKSDLIEAAIKHLPVNALNEIVEPLQGYVPTSISVEEFKLRVLGLPSLFDEVRHYNSMCKEKTTANEFLEIEREGCGPYQLLEIIVTLLNSARSASNYHDYLKSGLPPAEAFLAHNYARWNKFEIAYREIKQAYKLDISNNDVSQITNVNHFASLLRLQLQLEMVLSRFAKTPRPELGDKITETENMLKMWIAFHDRGADNGLTPFLIGNYEEIFAVFGDCSRESENGYREMVGVPRIGEGWVSEVELLNLVRNLFPNEKVVHQASPEWLGLQRFDIYLPGRKVAIEYQGRQHYEPVPFFGGEEGFLRTQERDRRKAELCAKNSVTLIYFRYDEPIARETVETKVEQSMIT